MKVKYKPDNGKLCTWKDFLEVSCDNITYAKSLVDRVSWQHPSTLKFEDISNGEVVEKMGTCFLTHNQKNVFKGVTAYKVYMQLTEDNTVFTWENTWDVEPRINIGGYFRENGCWLAFDFTSGSEVFIEEFKSKRRAIRYATGIPTKIDGHYL